MDIEQKISNICNNINQTGVENGRIYLEGVFILLNSFFKLKTVADNAILLNYAVSSENISERIKIKTENGFYLKALFPIRAGKGK